MRHTLILMVLTVPYTIGCGEELCTQVACRSGYTLEVRDLDGAALSTFSGTVGADGDEIEFECANGNGESANYSTQFACRPGAVTIFLEPTTTVAVTVSAAEGAFVGEQSPRFEPRFLNGNGESCGVTCRVATDTVTLRP